MFKLQFKDNPNRSIWLVGDKVTLGRHPDNTLVLDGLGIEEFHAELLIEPKHLLLKSKPGTCIVNDLPVDGEFELSANDELRIGKERLVIVDPQRLPQPEKKSAPASEVRREKADWVLIPDHAKLKSLDFSIHERAVLGRSTECALSVPYKLLSREHAELWIDNGVLYVRDLGSSNGTFVNGKRVEEARLANGDKLAFAKLVFSVQGPETAAPKPPPGNAEEMNRTIIRPAINLDAELEAKKASDASRSIELEEVHPQRAAAASSVESTSQGRGRMLAVLGGAVVVAALAAAWFIMRAR